MIVKPSASLPSATRAYQLHVELEGVRPKVWRRLLVPVTIELPLLHVMLLWGTGWGGGHLHEFVFGDASYGPVEPLWELPDGVLDEEHVTLKAALGARKTFVYVYDYGDNWRHRVKIEKIVELDAPISLAVCVAGENACPPEDVGGAPGYEEFLAALADPGDPEHEDLKEWIGGSFDPTAFDIDEVNKRLNQSED